MLFVNPALFATVLSNRHSAMDESALHNRREMRATMRKLWWEENVAPPKRASRRQPPRVDQLAANGGDHRPQRANRVRLAGRKCGSGLKLAPGGGMAKERRKSYVENIQNFSQNIVILGTSKFHLVPAGMLSSVLSLLRNATGNHTDNLRDYVRL